MNLEEIDKDYQSWTREVVLRNLEEFEKRKQIDLLDFVPENFRKKIQDKPYGSWMPPGSPNTAKVPNIKNLAAFLASPLKPEPIMVNLMPYPDEARSRYAYGLAEKSGINFERFKELVGEGELLITLASKPAGYKAHFYQDIFKACEKQDYLPPFQTYAVTSFLEALKLRSLAISEKIPPARGWSTVVKERYPEYDLQKILDQAKEIFDQQSLETIRGEMSLTSINAAINYLHQRRLAICAGIAGELGIGLNLDGYLHSRKRGKRLGLILDLIDSFKLADCEMLLKAVVDKAITRELFDSRMSRFGIRYYYPREDSLKALEGIGERADSLHIYYDGSGQTLLEGYRSFLASFLKSVKAGNQARLYPFVYADENDLRKLREFGLVLERG